MMIIACRIGAHWGLILVVLPLCTSPRYTSSVAAAHGEYMVMLHDNDDDACMSPSLFSSFVLSLCPRQNKFSMHGDHDKLHPLLHPRTIPEQRRMKANDLDSVVVVVLVFVVVSGIMRLLREKKRLLPNVKRTVVCKKRKGENYDNSIPCQGCTFQDFSFFHSTREKSFVISLRRSPCFPIDTHFQIRERGLKSK